MPTITTKAPKSGAECTVNYNFGGTLEGAVDLFGAEAVYAVFTQQAAVKIQGVVRRALESGATQEEIQAKVDAYKFGVVNRAAGKGKTKKEKALNAFADMTPEEKAAFIAELKEQMAAAAK